MNESNKVWASREHASKFHFLPPTNLEGTFKDWYQNSPWENSCHICVPQPINLMKCCIFSYENKKFIGGDLIFAKFRDIFENMFNWKQVRLEIQIVACTARASSLVWLPLKIPLERGGQFDKLWQLRQQRFVVYSHCPHHLSHNFLKRNYRKFKMYCETSCDYRFLIATK